jgi:hypothetical protein
MKTLTTDRWLVNSGQISQPLTNEQLVVNHSTRRSSLMPDNKKGGPVGAALFFHPSQPTRPS